MLCGRAEQARKAAGQHWSLEVVATEVRSRFGVNLGARGQRISAWTNVEVTNARVPRDADAVWALVRVLSDWVGDEQPHERSWRNLVELAQPQKEEASPRSMLLDRYLEAAELSARSHPYPGVVPGTMPPLSEVYFRQRARGSDDASPQEPRTALEVLAGGHNCVVLGGPGGGKSSLLRAHLARAARNWRDGRRQQAVPVLVPCAHLAERRPLAELLAASVNRSLPALHEGLPPDFFATAPKRGVAWLVMADGLDEVTDPGTRREIVDKLRIIARGEQAKLFRFVVATRPLSEIDLSGHAIHYELQPFTTEEVESLARRWFTALGLPDAEQATEAFLNAVDRAGIAMLAQTPLMASMLCQLHAHQPGRAIPASRTEIFQRFTDLLYERLHTEGLSGIRAQALATLERWPPKVLTRAEQLLNQLPKLTERLAAEHLAGNRVPPVEFFAAQPEGRCPEIPEGQWQDFLRAVLLRSGLLTENAGQFVFLHQTILEYYAARHASRDDRARTLHLLLDAHEPRRSSGQRRSSVVVVPYLSDPRDPKRRFWQRGRWLPPSEASLSYLSFLLGVPGQDPRDATHVLLYRTATRYILGSKVIVDLVRLGTPLPARVVRGAADRLHELATNTRARSLDRIHAAEKLADLADPRVTELLRAMAGGAISNGTDRLWAVRLLHAQKDPGALDLAYDLARDPAVFTTGRRRAARWLLSLEDPRGIDLLHTLALDSTLDDDDRVSLAQALARHDRPRGVDVLYELATNVRNSTGDRIDAAATLAHYGHPRGPDLLYDLARNARDYHLSRVAAANVLAEHGEPRGFDLLDELAHDATIDDIARQEAAAQLRRRSSQRRGTVAGTDEQTDNEHTAASTQEQLYEEQAEAEEPGG